MIEPTEGSQIASVLDGLMARFREQRTGAEWQRVLDRCPHCRANGEHKLEDIFNVPLSISPIMYIPTLESFGAPDKQPRSLRKDGRNMSTKMDLGSSQVMVIK